MNDDDDFVAGIAADVIGVIEAPRYFEKLDDLMSPSDPESPPSPCDGTHALSAEILRDSGFDEAEMSEITAVLVRRGGHCDCEVLLNVAKSSRLAARYWKSKAASLRDEAAP